MRIAARFKLGSFVFYATLGRVQSVIGISSKIAPNSHTPMFDFDNLPLDEVVSELSETQRKYALGEIFIFTDKVNSYRAICYTQVTFKELLSMLANTPGVDDVFIIRTAQKGQATLRLGPKANRGNPEIVKIIPGRVEAPPKNISIWQYETGLDSRVVRL